MENILYKAFGKRIYKALLNLVGGSGGSGDVKTLVVDTFEDRDVLLVRQSDNVVFTSLTQEAMDGVAEAPSFLNFFKRIYS